MKRFSKYLKLAMLTLVFTAVVAGTAFAVEPLNICAGSQNPNCHSVCIGAAASSPACDTSPTVDPISGDAGIIKKAAVLLATVTGFASAILIIIGIIKYMTSRGEANAVASAKHTIMYALVGIVVTLFAQAIIIFVINRV